MTQIGTPLWMPRLRTGATGLDRPGMFIYTGKQMNKQPVVGLVDVYIYMCVCSRAAALCNLWKKFLVRV